MCKYCARCWVCNSEKADRPSSHGVMGGIQKISESLHKQDKCQKAMCAMYVIKTG